MTLEKLKKELYDSIVKSQKNGELNKRAVIALGKILKGVLATSPLQPVTEDDKNDLLYCALADCCKYFMNYRNEEICYEPYKIERCYQYFKTIIIRTFTQTLEFKKILHAEF